MGALIDVPRIRDLGRRDYQEVWEAMQAFVDGRDAEAPDEIWLVEHAPVFTLGQNAKPEHVLAPGDIPIVQVDRGGEVTYHGPGQLVIYPLINIERLRLGVRELVCALENAVVALCASHGIEAAGRRDAPGVYVAGAKLASIGLRIRKGWSYHGMAVNVSLDVAPFLRINPCGYAGLEICRLADLGGPADLRATAEQLLPLLLHRLGYNSAEDAVPAIEDET